MDPELLRSLLRADAERRRREEEERNRPRRGLTDRIRAGIRSIPGYETARDVALGITEAGKGVLDAAQTFGTRTVADAEGSYNFFTPEAIESDYFGRLEQETANRLAEEERSGLRRGAHVAGELGATGAMYIGGGNAIRGAGREVAERGASRLSRMAVSGREALRDAAAVAPLDAVSAAREGHSSADMLAGLLGEESRAGRFFGDVAETAPGRIASEVALGLGVDLGIRGAGHAIGATRDVGEAAAEGLRGMGERGSVVLPGPGELPIDDLSARRMGLPNELRDDLNLMAEERAWTQAMQTPGSKVILEDGTPGEVVRPAQSSTGMVLVRHEMEGAPVERWYSSLKLSPAGAAGDVEVGAFPKTREGYLARHLSEDVQVVSGRSVDEIDAEIRRLNDEYDNPDLAVDEDEFRDRMAELHRQGSEALGQGGTGSPNLLAARGGGALAGTAVGATQGDTPEERGRNALIGLGIGAGVEMAGPKAMRALDEMGEGGFAAMGRSDLQGLTDEALLAKWRQYQRGLGRSASDAEVSIIDDAQRTVRPDGTVTSGLAEGSGGQMTTGQKARGRETQAQERVALVESEIQRRGLTMPTDPYEGVRRGDVHPENKQLVDDLPAMSADDLRVEVQRSEAAWSKNREDSAAVERMAILESAMRQRNVPLEAPPEPVRQGVAPAFQHAPEQRPSRVVSLTKAGAEEIRANLGLDELPPGERMSMEAAWDEAAERNLSESALEIAQDAVNQKRGLRPVEHAAAVQRLLDLEVELGDARALLEEAARAGNDQVVRIQSERTSEILRQFDVLTQAVTRTGSESARSLAARRWLKANADNFSLAQGLQEARTRKGTELLPDEVRQIEELTNRIEALDAENAKLRVEAERLAVVKQQQLALATAETEARQARRQAPKADRIKKLQIENVDIKARLAKLGVRMNDLTGVSAEGVYLIGKLAANHIQQTVLAGGKAELDEIVQRVLGDLNNPQITARDVYEAMNARNPRAVSAQRRAVQAQVRELKAQAKLLTQVEDAENGIFQPTRKKPVTNASPELQRLRARLTELREAAYRGGHEARRIELTIQTINDLQDQLANHIRTPFAGRPKPIPTEELRALQTRVRGLRQEMRVEDRLADLEGQLKSGDILTREQGPQRAPYTSPALERNQIALKRAKQEWRQAIEAMAPPTVRSRVRGTANFLRTLKATADMSATLRQGLWLSTSRPRTALNAFEKSARAFFSTNTAETIDNAIRQHPNQIIRDRAGLQLAELGGPVSKREEFFASKLAERIPVFGEIVRASERSMTTTLNLLRSSAFDEFVEKFPNATTDELKAWANWVNVASGRGDLGPLKPIATELSTVIFAPRFAASRIQTPFMVLRHWKEPRVRRAIARDYAATVGLGLTALALADMAGLEVSADPRSSDFGKIRFDDTRIDLWGGVQQPARLMARLAVGQTDRAGLTGAHIRDFEQDTDPVELLGRFAAFKLAPSVTLPRELLTGRTAVGEETTPSQTAIRAVLPLLLEDVADTYRLAGPETAGISASLNFLGASTQTYGDSEAQTRRRIRQNLADGNSAEARALLAKWNQANPTNPIRQVR